MTFITDIERQISGIRPNVTTIGFFDGVHLGHRYLIEQVRAEAETRGLSSSLITFPVHPRKIMQADYQPKLLSTFDEKCALLSTTGADYCVVLPFTRELAGLSAGQFMKEVLWEQFKVRALVIGYDHRFGYNRSEGFEDYYTLRYILIYRSRLETVLKKTRSYPCNHLALAVCIYFLHKHGIILVVIYAKMVSQ